MQQTIQTDQISSLSSLEQVVCIHGFLGWKAKMLPIAKALDSKGYKVRIWGYSSRSKRISEHAEDLVDYLIVLAEENPEVAISFVAHSLGALIIRSALNHPRCPSQAKWGRAVLFAPPNYGCEFGRWCKKWSMVRQGLGKFSGRELLEMEEKDFHQLGDFPSQMELLVIAGISKINPLLKIPNDGLLGVDETRLKTPHNHVVIEGDHNALLSARNAVQVTVDFFRKESDNKKRFI